MISRQACAILLRNRQGEERNIGRTLKGYALVLIAATLWGSIGVFYKQIIGVYGVPTQTAVMARLITASVVVLGGLLLLRPALLRVRWRDVPYFAFLGLVASALVFVLYAYAIMLVGVSVAAVLQYTAPAFVTLLAWRLFGEPLDRVKLIALALCLSGVALIARLYNLADVQLNLVGLLCGLGSGLTFGLYSILGKRAIRTYNGWTITAYNLSFGALFLAIFQGPTAVSGAAVTPVAWVFIVAMAIGPTVAAHGLYANALALTPASNASIVATWEPVVAMILAYLVLGERLDALQLLGAAAILAGVILLSGGARRSSAGE